MNFTEAGLSQISQFLPLPVLGVTGYKPTGLAYSNYVTHPGLVVVVENQPLLQATLATNQSRALLLYGRLTTNYELQLTTNLANWQPYQDYTQTSGLMTIGVNSSNSPVFYRLMQK